MEYEINKHYPFTELDGIVEWWQTHREYDINEHREDRIYDTVPIKEQSTYIDQETGEEIIKEIVVGEERIEQVPLDEFGNPREYDDYVEIVPRDSELLASDLRTRREPLLLAFDKWEKAVVRGREEDGQEVMQWYHDLLDLQVAAFSVIPERIKYYL